MSSKRAAAMSQINKYTVEDIKNAATPDDAVAMFLGKPVPSMAPGTQPSVKEETDTTTVDGKKDEETRKVQGPTALDLSVGTVYDFIRGFYRSTSARLEGAPIPGGIGLPLSILFALFLLLLPVNGHTRIMWLWLAVTGQAEIGGALTPITALAAPPTTTGSSTGGGGGGTFSYNTGTKSVNPNQTGTTSATPASTTSKTSATSSQHTVISHSKHSSTVVTNKAQTHGGTTAKHKGGGPGPYETSLPDPTAPVAQVSYSYLLRSYNGYE
jgi:hypothetical protein